MKLIQITLGALFVATSLFANQLEISKTDRDRLKKETVFAIDLIQRYHYNQTPFGEIDSVELLKQYMEDWDGLRLFFTQEDQTAIIERFGTNLKPSYLYIGDLFPAFEIYNLYDKRVQERLNWIDERLKQPFDFTTDKSYRPDRSEADFPLDQTHADDLWEKRLTNELIVEILEGESEEKAIERIAKRYERFRKFADETEIHNVQETFLTSLAKLYDPHSNFFSWDSAQEFQIQISNSLDGIGAQLRDVEGYCVIERLIPGGPAEMSGQIHPGDKIVAVGQEGSEPVDVVGMKLRKIVQMIRGETGSTVHLSILPAQSTKRKNVSLVREKIELTANLASAEIITIPSGSDKTTTVGVINLPSFYGEGQLEEGLTGTTRDVQELIEKLKEFKIDGLVLDLRNNGGGLLDEAVKLTGLFIPEGPVVLKKSFNGELDQDWDRDPKVAYDGPLVVLVSRASASASEIVAGALQAYGRAVVVGDPSTHGKGTVQAPIDLRGAMSNRLSFSQNLEVGTVKITIQKFFLPNGESTQNRGVLADITLPSANMFLLDGEADLDHALEWDKIDSVEFSPPESTSFALLNNDLISQLNHKSLQRQNALEEFEFLKSNVAWYEERHNDKEVSLNIDKRRTEKDKLENRRDEWEIRRNELSEKLGFDRTPVLLSLAKAKEDAHQEKLKSTPLPNGKNRANQFYQKVFYYQESEEDKTHEIWVEYFNYEKALDKLDLFAGILPDEFKLDKNQWEAILTEFKNRDLGGSLDVHDPFKTVLGDRYNEEIIEKSLPDFFTKMVAVDPDILLDYSKLDIPLRESVRIISDWIKIDSPLTETQLASIDKKESDTKDDKEEAPAFTH